MQRSGRGEKEGEGRGRHGETIAAVAAEVGLEGDVRCDGRCDCGKSAKSEGFADNVGGVNDGRMGVTSGGLHGMREKGNVGIKFGKSLKRGQLRCGHICDTFEEGDSN